MKHLQHEFPVDALLIANVPQRLPTTRVINAEFPKYAERFVVIDDPIGDGGVEITERFGEFLSHVYILPDWRQLSIGSVPTT
ncbi:hypothetical protein [Kolteria novifilia]|uniref:hypothetical protein n=1 Tax=Kolteria novifilia TaxID=2527975 RepID=UPI003AF3522D